MEPLSEGGNEVSDVKAAPAKRMSFTRRAFLQVLALVSAVLALLPFSPILDFLMPVASAKRVRTKVGNVEELIPNSYKIFFWPSKNDPYHTNILVRLQNGEYRAFNRVCVHLQCLVRYVPERNRIECPCHGSLYRVNDAVPIGGPAFQIGRGLPVMKLEVDKNGDIYVTGIVGEIGFGRIPNKDDPIQPVKA